ncbi:MAG: carboxymuconolactone decarboxylase family protein [Halioglobus sp.]|nr:carboxymuconolactone decarboxylase family protein [Halioglobus sp.]
MATEQQARLAPLEPPQWNDEIMAALGAFPRGLQFVLTQFESEDGDPRGRNVLGCFAHYPELASAFLTFNNHVATGSTLSARERELLILRIGWLRKAEYEYLQHVILGLRAGLTEDEVARIPDGPDASGWSAQDADLVRVADELYDNACIAQDTWQRLAARYSEKQMLDMIFLVGCYETVAMMMKSLAIPLEEGVPPLDAELLERMHAQR